MNTATATLAHALAYLSRLQSSPDSVKHLTESVGALEGLVTVLQDYKPKGADWAPDVAQAIRCAAELNHTPGIRTL